MFAAHPVIGLLAVFHHLSMQPADAVTAGSDEQEGKKGVYQTGKGSRQHCGREARRLHEVLRIGFSNLLKMIVQAIRPIPLRRPI